LEIVWTLVIWSASWRIEISSAKH